MGDHQGTTGEGQQRLFQCPQSLDIQIVGRFVEQQYVGALFQGLGQLEASALTTGEILEELLLVIALEVEAAHISARRDFVAVDVEHVLAIGDRFPHCLRVFQRIA